MQWLKRKLISYLLRSNQKDIQTLKRTIDKKEEDMLLSSLWQNQAFRNWIVTRENIHCLGMSNNLKKPTDDEYLTLYGRRLEVLDLHITAKLAFNRRQVALEKGKKEKKV